MSRPSISQGTRFLSSLLFLGLLPFSAFASLPPEATAEELVEAALVAKDLGNAAEAMALYERAAALGSPSAKVTLANSLRFRNHEESKVRARALLLEAAEADHPRGMLDFALMASRGIGGPVDGPAAIHWATRAFEEFKENSAISLLGTIYEEGLGVPRDLKKSLAWYESGEAVGHHSATRDAERLRAAARMTPEEKLAAFQAALEAVRHTGSYHRDRGRTFWNYVRSLHDGGLTVEETTAAAAPGLQWLMEKDFHALASGLAATGQRFRPGIEAQLTAQQLEVVEQIRKSYADRRAPKPPIAQGQGWSEVFAPAQTAVAAAAPSTPAPNPTASKPAPAPAPQTPSAPQLTEFTHDANNWEEFFLGSARRNPTVFYSRHEDDVKAFHVKHPATPEQLRAAYRQAQAAFKPTPGADLGRERGSLFIAYTVALKETGKTAPAAASFAVNEFLELARSDIYNAYGALSGLELVDSWRDALSMWQQTKIKQIANGVATKTTPLPKVPDPWIELANRDPIGAANELYTKLYADLAARDKGVALLPEEQKTLEQLAGILPQASERDRAALDRRIREFINQAPGANDLSAGNQAFQEGRLEEAFRLFEKAAGAGSSGAKVNLAVQNYGEAHTLPFERRIALLEEAHAAGMPGAAQLIAAVHLEAEEPNLDEALRWARTSLEAGYRSSAKHLYSALRLQRRAIEQDPIKALAESNKPEVRQARETEMNEAVERLRDAALLGDINAMYDLAIFHFLGQPPGLRSTFRFNRPEHNLHLARFWFQQVLNLGKNISASASSNIPRWIAEIDATLALAKGREWTADEVIAALDGGTSQSHLSWLLAREGGTFSKREHTRILTSEGGKKIGEYSALGMQLTLMVVTGPGKEAQELVDAAIAARRQTAKPLPYLGDDREALRKRAKSGDPAAAYAFLNLPKPTQFAAPPEEDESSAEKKLTIGELRAIAVSQDYAPAQYLRIEIEGLEFGSQPEQRDLLRAFSLLTASAEAGSAEAARRVADYYRNYQTGNPVRPNLKEAEWWYAQAAALAWPNQFESTGGILEPDRNLAHLYVLERPHIGIGIGMNARDPASHRWLRELRNRGGVAQEIAEERIAYYGTSDAGRLDMEAFIAALPPALPATSADERAQLERDAAAGKTEAVLKLARALSFGEAGFRQNDVRAAKLYEQAAEAGSTEAMTALAEIYENGYGVPQDLAAGIVWSDRAKGETRDRATVLVEAAQVATRAHDNRRFIEPYLREAIALGSVEAKRALGSHMMYGRQVEKNIEKGMRLLKEAAEAGDMQAMANLSHHYREGKEVPQDMAAGHRWRVRAAEAGDQSSRALLAYHYNNGTHGAPLDKKQALHWARLAAPEDRSIRENLLPRLEREVAEATPTDPGEAAFARAASLQGDARLAALREAAQAGHVKGTVALIEDLTSMGNLHEAHWWAGRDWQLENSDTELEAKVLRDNLERRAGFNVVGLKTEQSGFGGKVLEGFTTARDQSLESSMPELAQALANSGGDPRRLVGEVEQVRDRFPDRAESHIALAQLSMDRPDFARTLLERAIELDRTHPQAHVLLARIEASSGQPYRAYYRLLELAEARPNSVQVATARAELLHALGGSKKERTDLRSGLRRLLEAATPPERFNGYVAAAKLAAGMDDLENAITDLSAAIAINTAPALRLERAQLHERLKNFPEALKDYNAILSTPGALNPQQKAELNARIEQVQKAMNAETTRLQGEVK